ncbi:hippurate hydrolase [Nonomuraea solani]|uniref:Hippurate hydrolase n=1 Tax=Nonomuraea solani TaxID=1144553 RepID=A0A1H6EWG5_9ACTN|nr:amidohydrolase [Nonomuraea solani]SEH02112.1 hippurate hydrolase [Nonomuraea solani]
MTPATDAVLAGLNDATCDELAGLYRDLHRHPELSFQEERTAGVAADRLRAAGFEVRTGVGGTGVVGVLRNGDGPAVVLRADMDALPVAEATGLPYASTATAPDAEGRQIPVMHACGHDMHVTCLAGAARALADGRDRWRGTLVALFQPAEEVAGGARAMVDDGLLDLIGRPDVVLGQHIFPWPAGTVLISPGEVLAAADSLEIRLYGRGGHGSQPERTVDPVVMAAATVMRLQTVVSREVSPFERAVLTVAQIHAGHKENVIADEASITVNLRSFSPEVRRRLLDGVERVVRAEAEASGAPRPPELRPLNAFPLTVNDPDATARVRQALTSRLGAGRVGDMAPFMGSEDFGVIGDAAGAPSVFWGLGCADPETYERAEREGRLTEDVPGNHSPAFAPVIAPTLRTGVETLVTAALAWLATSG